MTSARRQAVVRLQSWRPKCDGLFGKKPDCMELPVFECLCRRCARELPAERFYCCSGHVIECEAVHYRIRGRKAELRHYTEKS
jgi:hypothetical protein